MKKILKLFFSAAVILTAAVMSGCTRSKESPIMDEVLKDIPNVTETTELKDIPLLDNDIISVSEELTSETESTTSTTEEIPVTAEYDDSMFPVGEWVNVTDADEPFYSFDEDGGFSIGLQTHSIFGKYTFENGLLTLIFDIGIGFDDSNSYHAEYAFDVQREEAGYRLYYNSESSSGKIELPDIDSVSHTSEQELIGELSSLFSGFENRESFLLEYYEVWYAGSRYS